MTSSLRLPVRLGPFLLSGVPAPNLLNTARLLLALPNLLLVMAAAWPGPGPYGRPRTVRRLAIYVDADEPAALLQLVAAP